MLLLTVTVIAQWNFLERVVQLSSASVNSATMKILLNERRGRKIRTVIIQSTRIHNAAHERELAKTAKTHFAHLDVTMLILVVLFELCASEKMEMKH